MKRLLFLLVLLPIFANGQIVYPRGPGFNDSVTLTFFPGDPLTRYLPGGGNISIDTTRDTSSARLWQIGNTLKHAFSNDTIASRGIMTDTVHYYPHSTNSFFVLKLNPIVSNFIIDFWHKFETDSFHAGGIVEFSSDTGLTWTNIASCPFINKQNLYSPTNIIISGEAAFTGKSHGEQLSRFQFLNCWALRTTATSCTDEGNYESGLPLYFRFRFLSDATNDSLSGWMIDSIRLENPGCFPGYVSEIGRQSTIDLYPNPTTTTLTITSSAKIEKVAITNLLGQTVFSNNYNTKEVQINVANLPNGVYFVKVNGSEVRRFVKES